MFNGAIVALREGVLCPVEGIDTCDMFLVVSDDNAKWKGEPHPTPEQEQAGHWCAFLGQVPLRVHGAVKAGQYLGPVPGPCVCARVCMCLPVYVCVCVKAGQYLGPCVRCKCVCVCVA